jgi:hypothetical protein
MNSSSKKSGKPSLAASSSNGNVIDDFTSYNDDNLDQPSEAPRSKFSIGLSSAPKLSIAQSSA